MNKIISIKQAAKLSQELRSLGRKIVLAGGVFDILHIGHVKFLEKAQQRGDILFVFLESDDNTRKLKGKNRPVNSQKNRAIILSALTLVDYVVLLPTLKTDAEYDKVVSQIRPSIIATTANDPDIKHKKRQAKLINGKIAYVTKRVPEQSTSRIVSLNNLKAL